MIKPKENPPESIKHHTVYKGLENIDSEFHPTKISVPETETTERKQQANLKPTKRKRQAIWNQKEQRSNNSSLKSKLTINRKRKNTVLINGGQTEVKTRDKPVKKERTTDERKKHADSQNKIPNWASFNPDITVHFWMSLVNKHGFLHSSFCCSLCSAKDSHWRQVDFVRLTVFFVQYVVNDGRFRTLYQSNCISVSLATSVQRSHKISDVLLIARLTFNQVKCKSCGTQREQIFYVMQFLQSVWSSKRATYIRISHNPPNFLAQSIDERYLDARSSTVSRSSFVRFF